MTTTPEFRAVLAADLENLRARLEAATGTLHGAPGDNAAQAALASALHSLKGLAGMAEARPLGGAIAILEPVFERGVRLAQADDRSGAREAFGFCRGPAGEIALLIAETVAGRGNSDENQAIAARLRADAETLWPESDPPVVPPASATPKTPPPPADAGPEAPDDADVLAFLEELGVGGPAGPVRPPSPPPPQVKSTLADPLADLSIAAPGAPPPTPKGDESPGHGVPRPVSGHVGFAHEVLPYEADRKGGLLRSPLPTRRIPLDARDHPPGNAHRLPLPTPTAATTEGKPAVAPEPGVVPEVVDAEMLQYFVPETLEYCESIDHALAALEDGGASSPPTDGAEAPRRVLLRMWHTIKGAANSIGLATLGRIAHTVEDAWEEGSPLSPANQRAVAAMATRTLRDYLRDCTSAPAGIVPAPPGAAAHKLRERVAQLRRDAAARTVAAPHPAAIPAPPLPAEIAEPAAPGTSTFEAPSARVDPATLDRLMDLVGELTVSRNRLLAKVATFTGLQGELETCKNRLLRIVGDFQNSHEYSTSLPSSRLLPSSLPPHSISPSAAAPARPDGFGALEFDEYDDLNLLSRSLTEIGADTGELIDGSRRCVGDFAEESDRFRKVSTQLQEALTSVRMVPLTALFRRLRRVAVEAAAKEAKEVEWQTEGGDTRLDRVIVEEVFGPLLHLVRNALGHGIETPGDREAAGKPRAGRVVLRASQRNGHAFIELTDDGRGLNFPAIRARGLAAGLIDAAALAEWDDERLVSLLFQPGFSTRAAAECNDVGGRGVGLDVVLQQITRLGGIVEVESHAGVGCVWRLKLPVTLAIGQAMFVAVGGQTFALPLTFVERLAFCGPGNVSREPDGSEILTVEGVGNVPILRLETLLGLPPAPLPHPASASLAVVARVADKRLAFPVAGLGRRAEIVTKPLPALLADHPFFSGATIDTDGRAVLILDVPRLAGGFFARGGLFALVATRTTSGGDTLALPAAAPAASERILVVDDSMSVRKVAEKLLRELGYEVETANDGQAALELLEAAGDHPFTAVLTDLEMPRLDGFGLLAEVRGRAAWRDLPIVVVTSRQADKHRQRAAELGATDYLVKPFTKMQLAQKLEVARAAVMAA